MHNSVYLIPATRDATGHVGILKLQFSQYPSYTLHDHPLPITDSTKYLGITISNDLKWNKHISNITSNANSTLGILRRNLRLSSHTVKTHAYQALVRPHLQYPFAVWDPHTHCNTHKLEMVQRRAARYVCNRWHNTSSVTGMLNQLEWVPLATRRANTTRRLQILFHTTHNNSLEPTAFHYRSCSKS